MELSQEKREQLKNEIIWYFQKERDEKIGMIAAESILNFFIHLLEKEIYNQAVADIQNIIDNRIEELKYDLEDLLKI
tara:strand:+ start:112869 stop:113099 length:231 start_codon:yes stop_codon:yes gene_type:complete